MSGQELELVEPFVVSSTLRPLKGHWRVLDGVFSIMWTGSALRDPSTEFGNWNSVWRQRLEATPRLGAFLGVRGAVIPTISTSE